MMMQQSVLWELEGDLLQASMQCDKLRKKGILSPEEQERLADLEKRKEVLEKRIREQRMKG